MTISPEELTTEQKIAQWDYDMEHHAEGNTTEYSIASEAIEECKQLVQRLRAAGGGGGGGGGGRLARVVVMVSSPVDAGQALVTVTQRRWDEAQAIVRDLAAVDMRACNPTIERACPLCVVDLEHGNKPHAESCPWRRAVEATR
jgi:hypothetical protein